MWMHILTRNCMSKREFHMERTFFCHLQRNAVVHFHMHREVPLSRRIIINIMYIVCRAKAQGFRHQQHNIVYMSLLSVSSELACRTDCPAPGTALKCRITDANVHQMMQQFNAVSRACLDKQCCAHGR